MSRSDQATIHRRQQHTLQCALALQIQHRGRALFSRMHTPKIFRSAKLFTRFPDQHDMIALGLETRGDYTIYAVQEPDHADAGRWIDGESPCLIIKAHVPTHHWY